MEKKPSNIVRQILDLSNLPELTTEQKARLDAVAAMPEDQISYKDAPYRPDAVWTKAVELPGNKQQITLRIDADVLKFFRRSGARYQSRINAVLRSYVDAHTATKAALKGDTPQTA